MEKKLDSDEVNTLIEILDCFMRNQEAVINLWEFSNYERNLRNKLIDICNQMTKEEEEKNGDHLEAGCHAANQKVAF